MSKKKASTDAPVPDDNALAEGGADNSVTSPDVHPTANPTIMPTVDPAASLNAETGVLPWSELVRYFARGVVVKVDHSLDLVKVADSVSTDDTGSFTQWMENGLVARASDDDARDWNLREPEFWCVVTAPWVLVQETPGSEATTEQSTPAKRTLH